MTDIKTMSPATGEVLTKTGEVVNLVDVLGGATPVDETLYDIESYSPRTGLIIGSDGKAYDLVDLLQGGGSGPSGDCVTKEELEEKFAEKLQPIQDSVSTSEGKVSAMEGKVATCESKVTAIEKKVDGMDAVSIDMVEDLQEKLDKSEAKVDALWKLNQGQTYDFKEEVETGTSDAPAGAHYMSLEEVQGDTRQDNYHMGLAVDAGTVEDCAEAPIRELQMFGKTEQASTNGYQLINTTPGDDSVNGIDYSHTKDGIWTIRGTATTDAYLSRAITNVKALVEKGFLIEPGIYTFSVNVSLPTGVIAQILTTDGTSAFTSSVFGAIGSSTAGHARTVTIEQPLYCYPRLMISNGVSVDGTFALMCEKGSTAHDWEPYTGGIPSPNPDYPQEIQSVEQINLRVVGKNLNANEVVASAQVSKLIPIKKGIYVFSTADGSALGPNNNFYIGLYGDDRKLIKESGHIRFNVRDMAFSEYSFYYYGGAGYDHFTLEFDDHYLVGWGFSNQVPPISGYQVEKGSVVTEYEPYKEQTAMIIPPRPLQGVTGIEDFCDVEKGLWRYKNKARTIKLSANSFPERSYPDSTDLYGSFLDATTGKGINDASNRMTLGSGNVGIVANKFRTYTGSSDIYAGLTPFEIGLTSGSNFIRITVPSGYDFIEIGEVDCVYTLAQEEVELIDEADLTLLRSLMTYSKVTNVFIADQFGRDISSQFRFLRTGIEAPDDAIAPTPLYPSELHSIERLNVKISGKNLLKNGGSETVTSYGVTYRKNPDGSVHAKGTATANSFYGLYGENRLSWTGIPSWYERGKTYYCKDCAIQIMAPTGIIRTPFDMKFTAYDEGVTGLYIFCRVSKGETVDKTFYPQIEVGGQATEYEPYQEEVRSIIPPRALNRIGEYVDAADVDEGVWKYRLDQCDLKQVTNWAVMDNENWFYKRFASPRLSKDFLNGDMAKCNFAIGGYNLSGRATLRISNYQAYVFADIDTLEEWIAYLRDNEAYFIAPLDVGVEEPIDPDDLAFLRSLELLPADHHITITDQDGNDVSYLMEYIIKLSEVV